MGPEPVTTEAEEAFDHADDPNGEASILRVKSSSSPQSVAAALSHAIYDSRPVKLRAIGAGAVNQAVKACAIARGYVAPRGIDLSFKPGFDTLHMDDGEDISAVTFSIIIVR